MKKYCCITIDTEPDCSLNWERSNPLSFDSVIYGVPEILQPIFEHRRIKPVYFISPEVLSNEESVITLKNFKNACEFGSHLHGEYIAPEQDFPAIAGTRSLKYVCFDYSNEVERQKLANLTNLITEKLDQRPVSFRGAKYGADLATIRSLVSLGYRVDSSVTPHIDWSSAGGPNYKDFPDQPYFINQNNFLLADNQSPILEVPVSIGKKRWRYLPDQWFFYNWLRPSLMTIWEQKKLINKFIYNYRETNNLTLCLIFHTMEIVPAASPYVRTRWGKHFFISRLVKIIDFLLAAGFEFRTLREVFDIYDNDRLGV